MRDVSKQWINYTNLRKQTLAEARQLEEQTKPVPIYTVESRSRAILPALTPKPAIPTANINYSVAREKVRALADGFGSINMSYRGVGIKSFEYAYSDLVGED
jgi:hypothetical protein